MTRVSQRIDMYPMPGGETKILPCVCDEYAPCLWHWFTQRSPASALKALKEINEKKAEEFYVHPAGGPDSGRAVGSSGGNAPVRAARQGDGNRPKNAVRGKKPR